MNKYIKSQIAATLETIKKEKGSLEGVTVRTYGEEMKTGRIDLPEPLTIIGQCRRCGGNLTNGHMCRAYVQEKMKGKEDTTELLPCPFCGVAPTLKDSGDCATIRCNNLDCAMDDVIVTEEDYDSVMPAGWCVDKVVEVWNTRTSTEPK